MAEQQNSMFQQKYQMIINQASVREVMEEYGLKIVKKGKDFKTVCPFHDDHDPSLSTAEVLLRGMDQGDLDYREGMHPPVIEPLAAPRRAVC